MKKIVNLLLVSTFTTATFFSSCTKEAEAGAEASANPQAAAIEPGFASGNTVLTLTGSGLGAVTSIVFDNGNVPATFNPNFNTDNAVIFRVPDTANGGPQNIIFTNKLGKQVTIPFKVIALPTVSEVSNYNFIAGTQITLTGNNLGDVSKVLLTGTTTEATIVSKSKKTLVITMPVTTVNRAKLDITNSSGPITSTQEFVNLANAYKIFTDDYGTGWENASWGPATVSTTVAKSGTKSFAATYNKGNWSADGFASWNTGLPFSADYKFLSFWVRGASTNYTLYVTGDQRAGGYGNSDQSAPITIVANTWNYFKIPVSTLDLWNKGQVFKQLGFWIKGPDTQNETFYFDDVILIK